MQLLYASSQSIDKMRDSPYLGQGHHSDIHRDPVSSSSSSNVVADREDYSWFTENVDQVRNVDVNFYLDQLMASLVDYNTEDIAVDISTFLRRHRPKRLYVCGSAEIERGERLVAALNAGLKSAESFH